MQLALFRLSGPSGEVTLREQNHSKYFYWFMVGCLNLSNAASYGGSNAQPFRDREHPDLDGKSGCSNSEEVDGAWATPPFDG